MTSIKEKQVDKVLDRIIGNADDTLRVITKLALMNNEITPELVETIEMIKKQNEEDAKALNEELEMTLDASGNLVPVIGNSSFPYEPILTQERAGENSVCPITFTVDNGVINNVNGIIDCAGNIVGDVVYRLPVGNT